MKIYGIKLERIHAEVAEQYSVATSAHMNANFKLLSESPIFQILDKPLTPTKAIKESWINSFIIFTIIASIFASLFFIRKIIAELVVNELKNA
jgi:hypothetical protein